MTQPKIDFSNDEAVVAFRKYCEDRQPPVLSNDVKGYLLHCLQKAARNAAACGETPTTAHHQMFAVMAYECGHEELIPEFLTAAKLTEVVDGDGKECDDRT